MRGKKSHKGRFRTFTAPEEIDRQLGLAKAEESADPIASSSKDNGDDQEEEDESSDEGEDGEVRSKGVSHLIEIHNPNLEGPRDAPSRKEAEAAARAVMDPLKLKSEMELASDLARLALVRKEREQAALKREQEKQAREAAREAAAQRAQAKLQAMKQKGGGKPGGKRSDAKHASTAATKTSSSVATNASASAEPSGATSS